MKNYYYLQSEDFYLFSKDIFDVIERPSERDKSINSWHNIKNCLITINVHKRPSACLNTSWKKACENKEILYRFSNNDKECIAFPVFGEENKKEDAYFIFERNRPDNDKRELTKWVFKEIVQNQLFIIKEINKKQKVENIEKISLELLELLKKQAITEEWELLDDGSNSRYELLRRYYYDTYERLLDERKVYIHQGRMLLFNTGLVTDELNEIFSVYIHCSNNKEGDPPWKHEGFFDINSNQELLNKVQEEFSEYFKDGINESNLPQRASYFDELDDVVFDVTKYYGELNDNHIFNERIMRFPLLFLKKNLGSIKEISNILTEAEEAVKKDKKNDNSRQNILKKITHILNTDENLKKEVIKKLKIPFVEALNKSIKRIERNYTLAIPAYFAEHKQQTIEFLVPICLLEEHVPSLALVMRKPTTKNTKEGIEEKQEYTGFTIYPLKYAYPAARQIMRPEESWIHGAKTRIHRGTGAEGLADYIKATNNINNGVDNIPRAFLLGLGVEEEVKTGNTLGVYRDEYHLHGTPDILLPNEGETNGKLYHFVSQVHGQFVYKNKRWFYVDLNSTNKSFIRTNEQVIQAPANQEIEIHHGDEIKLANSPFLFFCVYEEMSGEKIE